ncbi:MAG: hypothetical protein ACM3XS_02500 [Bacteroidota bacterium]
MDIFFHLRRFARVILLGLIGLVFLKAIFICTALDVLLLVGLILVLLAVISGPC